MARRTSRLSGIRRSLRAMAFAGTMTVGMAVAPMGADQAWAQSDSSVDTLILTSGRTIEGWIQEETDLDVRIVMLSGGIRAERVFKKSDIVDIRRAGGASPAPEVESAPAGALASKRLPAMPVGAQAQANNADDAAQLYIVNLDGRWGVDVSETPLRNMFKDVDKRFGDLVQGVGIEQGHLVVDPLVRDEHIVVMKLNLISPSGFSAIFRVEELTPIIMTEMVDKGRRVVFWVDSVVGGAAFLPWISPEIFFTSEGHLRGMADLDTFTTGDELVDEKLIGAFLGAAEGFAIKGGYGDHLDVMRGMLRKQNWLFVRFEGGQPVYATARPNNEDGWLLLTDDGEGDNADPSIFEGNDILSLPATLAEQLGISDGTADSTNDLAYSLGIDRNYRVLEDVKGQTIFDRWTKSIDDAIEKVNPSDDNGLPLGSWWAEYFDIEVTGDFDERKRLRGQQIRMLKQISGMYKRYEEVLDPSGGWKGEADTLIAQHKIEAEIDARAERGSRGGGRGGRGGSGGSGG